MSKSELHTTVDARRRSIQVSSHEFWWLYIYWPRAYYLVLRLENYKTTNCKNDIKKQDCYATGGRISPQLPCDTAATTILYFSFNLHESSTTRHRSAPPSGTIWTYKQTRANHSVFVFLQSLRINVLVLWCLQMRLLYNFIKSHTKVYEKKYPPKKLFSRTWAPTLASLT